MAAAELLALLADAETGTDIQEVLDLIEVAPATDN